MLIGVLRIFKMLFFMYLVYKSFKVVNILLVSEVMFFDEFFIILKNKCIGLVIILDKFNEI